MSKPTRSISPFCRVLLALGLAVLPAQTAGAGVLYTCDLQAQHALGWVSPKMSVVVQDSGQVVVADGPTLHFLGGPAAAQATRRGDNLRLTWNIANAKDDRGQYVPTMKYVAVLNTKTMRIDVTARPVGPPQRFLGKGVCKSRKG